MNKDMVLRKQMGERIRTIRNEMKLSKEALARQIGITGQFLGVVESGKSDISYDKLKRLCDISGYSADYILFGKNPEVISETKKIIEEFTNEQIEDACEVIRKIAAFMKDEPGYGSEEWNWVKLGTPTKNSLKNFELFLVGVPEIIENIKKTLAKSSEIW